MDEIEELAKHETIDQRVIKVIENNQQILAAKVTADQSLNELGMDSLDGTNLLYALEEEFNIVLPTETRNLTSVKEIIDGVKILIAEQK